MVRTLLFDVETAPNITYNWELYESNAIAVEVDWTLLCFAWRWRGEKRVHSLSRPELKNPTSDLELAARLGELIDEADVAVAHNLVRFDMPKANTRIVVNNLPVPSPTKMVDTLQIARSRFKFASNKLDDIARQLGVARKGNAQGFQTWLRCMAGTVLPGEIDEQAWRIFVRYCKQDVRVLDDVHERFLPWMKSYPNVAAIADDADMCPRCGAKGTMQSRGWIIASSTRRPRFRCMPKRGGCGGWSAGRTVEKTGASFVVAS